MAANVYNVTRLGHNPINIGNVIVNFCRFWMFVDEDRLRLFNKHKNLAKDAYHRASLVLLYAQHVSLRIGYIFLYSFLPKST